MQDAAFRFWLFGLVCNVAAGVYKLEGLIMQSRKEKLSEEKAKANTKVRGDVTWQLAQDLLDVAIPAGSLQYLHLDEGLIGLCGTASSIMGAITQWNKV